MTLIIELNKICPFCSSKLYLFEKRNVVGIVCPQCKKVMFVDKSSIKLHFTLSIVLKKRFNWVEVMNNLYDRYVSSILSIK